MPLSADAVFDQLCQHARETALLASIESLLSWDERCLMPSPAGEYRAEQMTLLSGMIHQRQTEPKLGEWLAQLADSSLAGDPASDTGTTIRQLKRQYDKKLRLPRTLVEELTRTSVLGQQAWQTARRDNDFASFAPLLKKTVELKRQQAEAIGYPDCPYDALLDDFEPGELTRNVARVLAALRQDLVPLVGRLLASARRPDLAILHRHYPLDAQQFFGREVAGSVGFDFQRGRLDTTVHPFCTSLGPYDCRITTRYDEHYFNGAFFGILHEAGHGIYDQGLKPEFFGLPPGEAVSMGIHESQSRMWENLVGRGRPFWEHFFPAAQRAFPQALADVPLDDFYFAINAVQPSLIRVEADEATYNLHILIRFELEQDLIHGELTVDELPSAWNQKYHDYLGIEPDTDAEGVLQDIHWSAGLFGYFPTYSLGNLYASQLFAQADRDLGGLAEHFARGHFQSLHGWLVKNIHRPGQCYTAAQLVQRVTGRPISHRPLIEHLSAKLGSLYGLGPAPGQSGSA